MDHRHRHFHILAIDSIVNDRPSMCVTYDLELRLKGSLVADALHAITVDGTESGDVA
jgi:hypothetical protein